MDRKFSFISTSGEIIEEPTSFERCLTRIDPNTLSCGDRVYIISKSLDTEHIDIAWCTIDDKGIKLNCLGRLWCVYSEDDLVYMKDEQGEVSEYGDYCYALIGDPEQSPTIKDGILIINPIYIKSNEAHILISVCYKYAKDMKIGDHIFCRSLYTIDIDDIQYDTDSITIRYRLFGPIMTGHLNPYDIGCVISLQSVGG